LIPAFRDWHTDECGDDIIAEREFFLPKEFLNADHHFNGEFDEYGQFKGTISIYGENTENYVIPWTGGKGIPTKCGIFKFQMANVMGNFRESTLPEEEWVALKNKMELIGGLYIYRDGIRILPYGDTDFDWLDIEFKRTKHAGYYHFSHRRIFGVVEVTGKNNSGLQEKAGREGFRENDAYRQFKSILKNFLGRVVADFIREEGARSDRYLERRNELSKLRKALDARAESVSGKRNLLVKELECFFARHDAKQPRSEVADIEKRINMELADISNIADSSLAAGKVLDIERKFRSELESLRSAYQITKPRIGLTKRLVKEWEDYQNAWDELDRTIFIPARNFLENTIGIRAKEAKLELDRRLRIEIALNELKEDTSKTVKKERKNTTEAVEKVQSEIKKAASDSIRHVEDILSHVDAEFHRWGNIHEIPDEKLVAKRADLENKIISVRDQEAEFLRYLREQLESINFLHEGTGRLDELEALEQRTVQLEEQSDADLQLSQLGMAIEIINHEFDANIRTIRTNLRRLKAWADVNPDLDNLYKNVRTSFDHLDSYLTLFTPLQRRLQRTETEISGKEIALFLKDLFNERFKRHEINLVVTDAFSKKKIIGYPSSY
ncbi:MAG: hypothetical protein WCP55_20620, partial [Lentisphaerota bacterium]